MKSATVVSLLLLAHLGHAMAQTAKAPVEVPFEFVNNQIVLQVKIGGKGPFNVLLDTDTDPSAIDTVTARELGLQVGSRGAPASGTGWSSPGDPGDGSDREAGHGCGGFRTSAWTTGADSSGERP